MQRTVMVDLRPSKKTTFQTTMVSHRTTPTKDAWVIQTAFPLQTTRYLSSVHRSVYATVKMTTNCHFRTTGRTDRTTTTPYVQIKGISIRIESLSQSTICVQKSSTATSCSTCCACMGMWTGSSISCRKKAQPWYKWAMPTRSTTYSCIWTILMCSASVCKWSRNKFLVEETRQWKKKQAFIFRQV